MYCAAIPAHERIRLVSDAAFRHDLTREVHNPDAAFIDSLVVFVLKPFSSWVCEGLAIWHEILQ